MKLKQLPKIIEKEISFYTAEQIYNLFSYLVVIVENGQNRQIHKKNLTTVKKEIIERFKAGDMEIDKVVRASNTLSQIVLAAAKREGIAHAKAQVRISHKKAIARVLEDNEKAAEMMKDV